MRDTTNDKIAILSTTPIDKYPDYHSDLLSIRNLSHRPIVENHQNKPKTTSYVITINEKADHDSVVDIAKTLKQDHILISRKDRSTYKLSVDTGVKEELGYLKSVSETNAQKELFYFNDVQNDTYYVCID